MKHAIAQIPASGGREPPGNLQLFIFECSPGRRINSPAGSHRPLARARKKIPADCSTGKYDGWLTRPSGTGTAIEAIGNSSRRDSSTERRDEGHLGSFGVSVFSLVSVFVFVSVVFFSSLQPMIIMPTDNTNNQPINFFILEFLSL